MYALDLLATTLTIRPDGTSACTLWLNDVRIGRFCSANAAAQLVARRQTGRVEIDAADAELPVDVEGWRWISVHAGREAERAAVVHHIDRNNDGATTSAHMPSCDG